MPDLEISKLPPIAGALLQATDPLALADLSASETKSVTVKDLIQGGVALIDAGSIPGDKLNFALADGSVTTPKLADKAVTAAKLDDDSSTVVGAGLPAAGAFIGQLARDGATSKLFVWDGATWATFMASGSINALTYDNTVGPLAISGVVSGDSVALSVVPSDTTSGALFLAGPATTGGAVAYRQIESVDLPAATTVRGAVAVNGNGLKVTGDVIGIDNSVTASGTTYGVVQYDSHGLVVDGRRITGGDLPIATTTDLGAIRPGPDLAVAPDGALTHSNGITAGSAAKVVFDAHGHITAAQTLTAADIPALDAGKITTGTFPTALIGDHTVTKEKLADYATSYIQDVAPPVTGNTIGQLWLNPLAQQIRMWDGNVWVPIGVGALSEQNLRFCGLFDATNGQIKILTQFGRDAGYKVGDVLPVATDQLTGSYFVADTAGNGTAVTPGVNYDASDWIVCLGVAQGWSRIDVAGSGGGGGSSTLDGLVDVTITTPGAGQALIYDGTIWKNTTIASATEVVSGLIELATNAEVVAGTDTVRAVVPKTLADNYLAKNIAKLPALPA